MNQNQCTGLRNLGSVRENPYLKGEDNLEGRHIQRKDNVKQCRKYCNNDKNDINIYYMLKMCKALGHSALHALTH